MSHLNGIHTLSFYNPLNGTTVQVNNIKNNQGELVVARPYEDELNPRGEVQYAGDENIIEVAIYSQTAIDQLIAWAKAGVGVRVVGAGDGPNLQWYETTKLVVRQVNSFVAGTKKFAIVRMVKSGAGLQIFNNVNLLGYLGWADVDLNGLADGYSSRLEGGAAASTAFATNIQDFNVTTAGSNTAIRRVLNFPIAGIPFTMSYNRVNTASALERIDASNFAGTSLLAQSEIASTTTGIKTSTLVSPASSYSLTLDFLRSFSTAGLRQMSFPALTTNGQLTPGTSFMNY